MSAPEHDDQWYKAGNGCSALQARMGIKIQVLDPTPDCPASTVAKHTLGSFKEPQSIRCA